jgi:hypothetical protein
VLSVAISGSTDTASLDVSGNQIVVGGNFSQVTCTGGTPTTASTAAINVFNQPGNMQNTVQIQTPSAYSPGPSPQDGSDDDPGATPEIEIFVNLNDGFDSRVEFFTEGESVRLGTFGINPNATQDEVQPDADITLNNVPRVEVRGSLGGGAADTLSAQGGAGTGSARTDPQNLHGGGGQDAVTGGEGDDVLGGGTEGDALLGMGGSDTVDPGGGDDTADGGPGTDTYAVAAFIHPVAVDLAVAGPQQIGLEHGTDTLVNFENARVTGGGTDANAVLRGDANPNSLTSADRNDTLEGRGGMDSLSAGLGNDDLDVRDGGSDTAACGLGNDTVTTDAAGVDTLMDCETVLLPPAPEPPGGEGSPPPGSEGSPPPGGEGSPPPGGAPGSFGAKTLVSLRLAASRISAVGPLAVRVANGNGFAVTGSLSGRTVGQVTVSRRRTVKLKAKSFTVGASAAKTVKLRLPATLRRLLARKGRLALRVTARVRDPAGKARTVTKTLAPKLRRPSTRGR